MWGPELQEAFERDGHVCLKGAFDPAAAERMTEAAWDFVETRTSIRREDRSTWPERRVDTSFKPLKRHLAFRAVLDSEATRSALDGIFGPRGWTPARSGAQILFTFPDIDPEAWRVPSALWHMDTSFHRRVMPPRAVKLFSVAAQLPPRGGATMVLAGTPNLQAAYAREASAEQRAGNASMWRRFLARTDPWLASFANDRGEPNRNETLFRPTNIDSHRIELRELGGDPGDVHVTHINLFHSESANANDRPRLLVTHGVRPVEGPGARRLLM